MTPSDAVEAGDWIESRLQSFGSGTAGSVVPTGFPAYARSESRAGLAAVLARHTSTPHRCWFCLWDGYGYLHGASAVMYFWASDDPHPQPPPPPPPPPLLRKSRVRLPNRDYLLFTGSAAEAEGWDDGPNLWWPDDRAWCAAAEIDLDYTLIGGSSELRDELVRAGARPIKVDDPL